MAPLPFRPLCFAINLNKQNRLKFCLVWLHHFPDDQTPMVGDIGSMCETTPNSVLASVYHAITKVSQHVDPPQVKCLMMVSSRSRLYYE